MSKKDKDLDELLKLLRRKPDLIKALIFDPEKISALLSRKSARRLLSSNTQDFLEYLAGPDDGFPIAACLGGTAMLSAKGGLQCLGGTILPGCVHGTAPPTCIARTGPPCRRTIPL